MDKSFITPPNHVNFMAKKLFADIDGHIKDGSIAYLSVNGGGPTEQHTHAHDHLFIVTRGEAKVMYGTDEIIIHENESFLVKGSVPHSVWNNCAEETIMIGITIED